MDLEKQGQMSVALQGENRRVKALQMADLENAAAGFGGSDHAIRRREIRRHRLFDQDVDPRFQQATGEIGVLSGWDRDDCSVYSAHEISPVRQGFHSVPGGCLRSASGIEIDNCYEARAGMRRGNTNVVRSELPGSDDGNPHRCFQFRKTFPVFS
jgi:hypothetical protein